MRDETFIPRDYDVFAGLDVDKRSISVTFANHQGLLSRCVCRIAWSTLSITCASTFPSRR